MAQTIQMNLNALQSTMTPIAFDGFHTPILGAPGPAPLPVYLTAESLMLYCESQLRSLDGEVSAFLNEQRANIARKKALGDVIAQMKKYAPPAGQEQWNEFASAIRAAVDSLPPGDPTVTALQDLYGTMASSNSITKAQWDAAVDNLQGRLDEVSGNAEMNMIRLQTVMSQRQMAIQLTTGMLQKFDQGLMAPINNLGR
ncbi:MAG: hypothetical protein IT376_00505 [Polyangiaceae bacterium]|nr:hypothetical protein [Polyangiaceae bacterium]